MSTEMSFTLSSPAEVLYNQAKNVKQVDVSSLSGSFGILANHVPVIAVLKPGVLTVHEDNGNSKKFFVSSGSVSVNSDSSVQVLAEEAFPLDKLDLKSAQEQLNELQRALGNTTSSQDRAEVEVQIECVESVIRAVQTGQ
jgi:F-type H+-transporting ATPase subunit delta